MLLEYCNFAEATICLKLSLIVSKSCLTDSKLKQKASRFALTAKVSCLFAASLGVAMDTLESSPNLFERASKNFKVGCDMTRLSVHLHRLPQISQDPQSMDLPCSPS